MTDSDIERLAAEYIAEDWTPDRYYRDMNIIAFATKLLEAGFNEGRAEADMDHRDQLIAEGAQQLAYAEGRKDEREELMPLLQKSLEALETCDGDEDGYKGPTQWFHERAVAAAIAELQAAICPVCRGRSYTVNEHGQSQPCDCYFTERNWR